MMMLMVTLCPSQCVPLHRSFVYIVARKTACTLLGWGTHILYEYPCGTIPNEAGAANMGVWGGRFDVSWEAWRGIWRIAPPCQAHTARDAHAPWHVVAPTLLGWGSEICMSRFLEGTPYEAGACIGCVWGWWFVVIWVWGQLGVGPQGKPDTAWCERRRVRNCRRPCAMTLGGCRGPRRCLRKARGGRVPKMIWAARWVGGRRYPPHRPKPPRGGPRYPPHGNQA